VNTFEITREHEIAAGHRVFGHESKCAHLHGHNYRFELTCSAPELDHLGRVTDFAVLKTTLCAWLEREWDHRTLLWSHDHLALELKLIDPAAVVVVEFNPTAENIAAHLVNVVGPALFRGTAVTLVRVRVWETSKCSAVYGRHDAGSERCLPDNSG
jgi:6-pyruvoyltetrahydropterin/6-carboxytetrahydropterin synthase